MRGKVGGRVRRREDQEERIKRASGRRCRVLKGREAEGTEGRGEGRRGGKRRGGGGGGGWEFRIGGVVGSIVKEP